MAPAEHFLATRSGWREWTYVYSHLDITMNDWGFLMMHSGQCEADIGEYLQVCVKKKTSRHRETPHQEHMLS